MRWEGDRTGRKRVVLTMLLLVQSPCPEHWLAQIASTPTDIERNWDTRRMAAEPAVVMDTARMLFFCFESVPVGWHCYL
jgi:hypothetical protein